MGKEFEFFLKGKVLDEWLKGLSRVVACVRGRKWRADLKVLHNGTAIKRTMHYAVTCLLFNFIILKRERKERIRDKKDQCRCQWNAKDV